MSMSNLTYCVSAQHKGQQFLVTLKPAFAMPKCAVQGPKSARLKKIISLYQHSMSEVPARPKWCWVSRRSCRGRAAKSSQPGQVTGPAQGPDGRLDLRGPLQNVPGGKKRRHAFWVRQHSGQKRCLPGGDPARGCIKKKPARRISAVHARAELHNIEIDLQNAALRPHDLDQHGEIGFERLANKAPAGPEVEVLGQLLGDRAGPAQVSALFPERAGKRLEVEAMMLRKLLVFGSDNGNAKIGRYLTQRHPPAVDGAFILEPVPDDVRGRWRCDPAPGKRQGYADEQHDAERFYGAPIQPPLCRFSCHAHDF